jgi:hypothetical protein
MALVKQYVLFHTESGRPILPLGEGFTKEEAEAELERQEFSEQLEIREFTVEKEE